MKANAVSLMEDRSPCQVSCRTANRGFTVVELVVTLVVIGIMAVVILPRFMGRTDFDAQGFQDQLAGAIQFSRQQAIAQRRTVCVAVEGSGLAVTRARTVGGACVDPLLNPATGAAYAVSVPSGLGLVAYAPTAALPLSLNFDALGRPNAAAGLRITGSTGQCLTVETETGYVRTFACP